MNYTLPLISFCLLTLLSLHWVKVVFSFMTIEVTIIFGNIGADMLSFGDMQNIFRQTRIIRKPTYGIVSGYHELPYICIGESYETGRATTRVRGKVQVSPRFIVRPSHCESSYEEIFGENNVDIQLAGRVFGFLGFREHPVECKSEHLEVQHLEENMDHVLSRVLDDIERMEDITTGVIITPDSRYYPVSIERFISSILQDEFSV